MKRNYAVWIMICVLSFTVFVQQMNISLLNKGVKENCNKILDSFSYILQKETEIVENSKAIENTKEEIEKTEEWTDVLAEHLTDLFSTQKEIDKKIDEFKKEQIKYNFLVANKIKTANIEHLRLSTVEIKVGDCGGSGVIAGGHKEDLWILTAKHVVSSKGDIKIKITDINRDTYILDVDRKKVDMSDEVDLALIRVKFPEGKQFAYMPLESSFQYIGTKVYVMGHPYCLHYTLQEGIISNYINRTFANKKGTYMLISAPVYGGNSGGAVINKYNKIIGIVVGVIYHEEGSRFSKYKVYNSNLTIAVKLEDIYIFIRSLGDKLNEEYN